MPSAGALGAAQLCPPVKERLVQQLVSPGIPEQVSNRCGNSKCHQWKWLSCLMKVEKCGIALESSEGNTNKCSWEEDGEFRLGKVF